ncbi:MAG: hypothetical protein E7213_02780 [Clostridium sp.]|nr:hypothetical protein [Clostridium sp.]
MNKIIYLYNQNNVSSQDKLYDIILSFFKSIETTLVIIFLNYFFNDSLNTNDTIEINEKNLSKNNYIPLDYSLSSISFTVNDEYIYSIEIQDKAKNNFSFHLLKYKKIPEEANYFINLPESKIIEFEDNIYTSDKFRYNVKLYNHTLSYDIPVYKFFKKDLDFIKSNNLYILFPFISLFSDYSKIINASKIGSKNETFKNEILKIGANAYKDIKKIASYSDVFTKRDYCIIKDTIAEIIDYYLESIET